MNCEVCGRAVLSQPITRKLMWQERHFCSGQCVSLFDQRLLDPHLRAEDARRPQPEVRA